MAMKTSFRSVAEMWHHRISSTPDSEAFIFPADIGWQSIRWREAGQRSRTIGCGLLSQGMQAEQRCAILCSTRVEWILIDMGILEAGGATTTIYPSNTAEESAYILRDSQTRFVFVENDEQVNKLVAMKRKLSKIDRVIVIDGVAGHDGWVITLKELEEQGSAWDEAHPGKYDDITNSITGEQLATLIYTSGTTGEPKGVELTHDNWVFEGEAMDALGILSPADRQFLFLPLAHSFAKVMELATIRIGIPTIVDGREGTLEQSLRETQPTFMAGVPRVFEKMYNQLVLGSRQAGGPQHRVFRWALGVGRGASTLQQQGRPLPSGLAFKHRVADRLVFRPLKEQFGGRLRFFISGGAPLSLDMTTFFHSAGVLILEGYGLTESSAANFVNRPKEYRFGTVGKAIPGVDVKIAPEDGEILLSGRCVMRGYFGKKAATKAALKDGWLHTGDIGTIDADGFLKITDRKKDLIKTSGGKYVAPQMLENALKARCPYISQVLVHGNNRNYCTALLALDETELRTWARDNGLVGKTGRDLLGDERVRNLIDGYISGLNDTLASFETIKGFAILPHDLTVQNGFLTPTLKVKRKEVEAEFSDLLDGFYEGAVAAS